MVPHYRRPAFLHTGANRAITFLFACALAPHFVRRGARHFAWGRDNARNRECLKTKPAKSQRAHRSSKDWANSPGCSGAARQDECKGPEQKMTSRANKSETEGLTAKLVPMRTEPDARGSVSPFATVREAAKWLRVSERTVRRWIKEGLLPCRHFGRTVRIAWKDLKDFASKANA